MKSSPDSLSLSQPINDALTNCTRSMDDIWGLETEVVEIEETEENTPTLADSRAYQKELLAESIKRNVIIALDTGSGKTHIAILRLRHETEQNPNKVRHHILYL